MIVAILKAEVDKIDADQLKAVPDDLSTLSNVLGNDVVKKTVYDKLVTTVNAIDTNGFVLKSRNSIEKSGLEKKTGDTDKKIPDFNGLFK